MIKNKRKNLFASQILISDDNALICTKKKKTTNLKNFMVTS